MCDIWSAELAVKLIVEALRYPDRELTQIAVKVALLSGRPLNELLHKAQTKDRSNPWIVGLFVEEVYCLNRADLLQELLGYEDERFCHAAAKLLSEGPVSMGVATHQLKLSGTQQKLVDATPEHLEPLNASERFIAHLILGENIGVTDIDRLFPLLQSSRQRVQIAARHAVSEIAISSPGEFLDALAVANVPTDAYLFEILGTVMDPPQCRSSKSGATATLSMPPGLPSRLSPASRMRGLLNRLSGSSGGRVTKVVGELRRRSSGLASPQLIGYSRDTWRTSRSACRRCVARAARRAAGDRGTRQRAVGSIPRRPGGRGKRAEGDREPGGWHSDQPARGKQPGDPAQRSTDTRRNRGPPGS